MKTSIIVLTCNGLRYSKECIESIKRYTEKDYEIIVVDNNSNDGTKKWLSTQKDIKAIYNKENYGFPKGCNQGINAASGDDVLLLNNDVIVTPNWLKNLRICLYSNKEIGAVGPVTNNCSNGQSINIKHNSIDGMVKWCERYNKSNYCKWKEKNRLVGFCLFIKKEVINKIGLLDERFSPGNYEDDDYSFRIRKAGYKLILCEDTFIYHYGGASFSRCDYLKLLQINKGKFEEKWGIKYDEIFN